MPVSRNPIIDEISAGIDVPPTAYEAAIRRYEDLGDWLNDKTKARSALLGPHVFPQGSFRLGTVARPLGDGEYDLDLTCELQKGISKSTHSQEQLKTLLGADLETYRGERRIKDALEEKRRCWRLNYRDNIEFHMDIVPAIPEDDERRRLLVEGMVRFGVEGSTAATLAGHAKAITDNEDPDYHRLSRDWHVSNQEGYALWFESRMRQATQFLEKRAASEHVASIDALKPYRWKTPLQLSIQILKRHRDKMFESDHDVAPISVIISTLSARAYTGETDVESALRKIVKDMPSLVNPTAPRVANPVDPREDFADKWPDDPRLERSFRKWVTQMEDDLRSLSESSDVRVLSESALRRFGTKIDEPGFRKRMDLLAKSNAISSGLAYTGPDGRIGAAGVKNTRHEFYG